MVWLGLTRALQHSAIVKPGRASAAVPNAVELKNEHRFSVDIERGLSIVFSVVLCRVILDRSLSRFAGTRLEREADRR